MRSIHRSADRLGRRGDDDDARHEISPGSVSADLALSPFKLLPLGYRAQLADRLCRI